MDHERRVQVVLGEAERTDGLLRFVLEAEGFDLVGLASNDEELFRVMRGARPSVVVLDGGISAAAALEARKRCGGAALVVVWPDGVSAVLAEERVEPSMVIEDLGDAVRRAVDRVPLREEVVRVPEASDLPAAGSVAPVAEESGGHPPQRHRGRRAQVLVAVATWLLVITALTAIATGVPNALDVFSGPRRERPSIAPPAERRAGPAERRAGDGNGTSAEPTAEGRRNRCEVPTSPDAAERSGGGGKGKAVRAEGCPPDRGNSTGGKAGGGGRPDDPGNRGNGGGPPGGSPGNEGGDGAAQAGGDAEGPGGKGSSNEEHGDAGVGGEQAERGRAGAGGSSNHSG